MTVDRTSAGKVIVVGGRLVDGCGNPWVRADVFIEDGRVAEIAPPGRLSRAYVAPDVRIIDAEDRYVTPGFIDGHTHSDVTILKARDAEGTIRQGVTTHVTGNCGMSPAPMPERHRDEIVRHLGYYWDVSDVHWEWSTFAEYMHALEDPGVGINLAPLVGHGTLRIGAMGNEDRAPTAAEMEDMKRLLAESLEAGAYGLSSGLVYPPGCYSDTAELVELAKVVARYGGLYASHIRGERETIIAAIREAETIGEQAGIPVEVSHNAPKWGGPAAAESLEVIAAARERGQDVTVDNDTHTDLAPKLSRALPQPVIDLDHDEMISLLRDPGRRQDLRRQIADDTLPGAGYSGLVKHAAFERIVVLAGADERLVGRSVADIAEERSADALDTFLDLIVEGDDEIVAIFDYIEGSNVETLLTHPLAMIASDGFTSPLPTADAGAVDYWPCCFGEYARVLEHYVKETGLLRLEEAVRKMTSYPAQRFGLWDRGALRPGLRADLAVFDLDAVRDHATNEFPHAYPFRNIPPRFAEGMDYVFVNGTLAIDGGRATGALAGQVLRRARAAR